jgi:hypothetical protein
MSHSEPLSPLSLAPGDHLPQDEDEEMADAENDAEEEEEEEAPNQEEHSENAQPSSRPPCETRKDRDLNDFLNDMDKYAPIVHSLSILSVLIARSPMQ